MHLSQPEIDQFYRVWWSIMTYVNKQLKLSSTFDDALAQQAVHPEDLFPIREALWADDSLRETFIKENPAELDDQDLALVESWQHRVADTFYIVRYLKAHAVFIDSQDRGYGVHGITDPIEMMFGGEAPLFTNTVLLPFKDRIIYDSLMSTYPLIFGPGMRASVNDTYRSIRERGSLITQLPINLASEKKGVQRGNKKILTAFKRDLGKTGLRKAKIDEHRDTIATFAEQFLLQQTPPVSLLDITPKHLDQYAKSSKTIDWISFERFARFLLETERMYWEEAEELLYKAQQNQ